MARPVKAIRPIKKRISLPEDIVAQVDLFLYSPAEGRVPYSAWADYVVQLVRQDLERRKVGANVAELVQ